ncbi:MAG TPA: hypothetical protein VI248_04475 [Kineosporiaceae bacterium]
MARVNVYLPDDLAGEVKLRHLRISALCQDAIRREIDRMNAIKEAPNLRRHLDDISTLTVEVGDDAVETEFRGAWIIDPDDATASGDQDATWGVAVTGRGRYAVHTRHVNERPPAQLEDFDTLDELLARLPSDIASIVEGRLTGRRVLDI